jgi:hypothetical protein
MRRSWLVPLALFVAACGSEGEKHVYLPSFEGQSPPEPPPVVAEAPAKEAVKGTAQEFSPAFLRSNAPVQWETPAGWVEEVSTKPQRLVEFTLERNGPGGAPVQFILLNGLDEYPGAKQKNLTKWETDFHEDIAPQTAQLEHDGLRISRWKFHGTYEGPIYSSNGAQMINEPNWTMICGWVEGPNGSVMFKLAGPDSIVKPAETKVDLLLASMKPREMKK